MGGDRWGWRREFEYLARFMGAVEINPYINPSEAGWSARQAGALADTHPPRLEKGSQDDDTYITCSCIGVGQSVREKGSPEMG